MISVSQHQFYDDSNAVGACISIAQVIDEEYGLHVWPCSIALAEYVWQNRGRFSGVEVLELGAGTALTGILAAKVGAHVTLTDIIEKEEVLENMKTNCERNAVHCKIQGLTWAYWDNDVLDLSPDIIIGADVLYDAKDFDDLFAMVAFMLFKKPEAVFITAYEPRSRHQSIELLMMKWKLKCTKLLDAHKILPEAKQLQIPNSVEIVEIQAASCHSKSSFCNNWQLSA